MIHFSPELDANLMSLPVAIVWNDETQYNSIYVYNYCQTELAYTDGEDLTQEFTAIMTSCWPTPKCALV
jgi:hypothetical protein